MNSMLPQRSAVTTLGYGSGKVIEHTFHTLAYIDLTLSHKSRCHREGIPLPGWIEKQLCAQNKQNHSIQRFIGKEIEDMQVIEYL